MARPPERTPKSPDEELLGAEQPTIASTTSDSERLERVQKELKTGFGALARIRPAVSVFGSARVPVGDPQYELTRELARRLGEEGLAVITGGGPGLMEAANRGAQDADVASVGLRIELPFEQGMNQWVDIPLHFHYFFTRKVMFVRYASAFVILPGGFGTLDELFEAVTLIQTKRVREFPVVLVGTDYWSGLISWMRDHLLAEGKIDEDDLDLFVVSDDPDEVVARVVAAVLAQGLAPGERASPGIEP